MADDKTDEAVSEIDALVSNELVSEFEAFAQNCWGNCPT